MKRIGLLIALFAGLILVFSPLTAQDEKKKDGDKTEKKDDAKKDEAKKDEKKDPEKKDDEKKKGPPAKEKKVTEKMPPYSQMFRTKILSAAGESNREFTIELQEIDPKKVYDFNNWKAQRTTQLAQQQFNANRETNIQSRAQQLANYQRDYANFQIELAKRSNNLTSPKAMEVRAHEDAKIRTAYLPVRFDDQGFQKKWTEKEKREFRGDTTIPGYPADFDVIKSGQFIDIYMAKKPAAPKDAPKKKKADDDPLEMKTAEFILIVVIADGK